MSWHAAPAVKAALREATTRWPNRSKVSDGTIGDAKHSARTSDHNPDERGVVLAFDLTCDLDAGCDAHALVREAVRRRDPRIKYAISQGRIWSKKRADEGWRPYTGSNRHDKHAHVSVDRRYEDDTSDWWGPAHAHLKTDPDPAPPPLILASEAPVFVVYAPNRATCLLSGQRMWLLENNQEAAAWVSAGASYKALTDDEFDSIDACSRRWGVVK